MKIKTKQKYKEETERSHERKTEVLQSDLMTCCKKHAKICGTRTTKKKEKNRFYAQNTFLIVHPHQEVTVITIWGKKEIYA